MKSPIIAITGAIIIILLAGCSAGVNDMTETDMGTHHIVVKPGSMLTSSSEVTVNNTETHQFSCGEISVTIQNEELIVNDVKYGMLKTGESVLIDNGKVYVADQLRQGTAMSDQEVLSSSSVKESTEELAGFSITVRPGSMFTSTSEISGKHTLTVGKTTVSIKNKELFVNRKSYGQLKPGDTILIENKKVSISGKVTEQKK